MCSSMNACKRRCRPLVFSLKSKFIVADCFLSSDWAIKRSALLNSLVLRITNGFQVAIEAARLAGNAHAATMPDELVRELNPFFLGNDAHEVLLDFLGFFVLGEIEAAREPHH